MKRMNILPEVCRRSVCADIRLYGLAVLLFLTGGVMAALFVFGLQEAAFFELQGYLEDFFQNMHQSGADSGALFKAGFYMHVTNFGVLFLFSCMVIGAPFIAAYATLKGFMHSFTLFFMFRIYGLRAALFFLLGMLPHYLLLIPCYSVLFVHCLKFITSLRHEKRELKVQFLRFLPVVLLLFALSLMATLLQAYVEPVLIRAISGMFIV